MSDAAVGGLHTQLENLSTKQKNGLFHFLSTRASSPAQEDEESKRLTVEVRRTPYFALYVTGLCLCLQAPLPLGLPVTLACCVPASLLLPFLHPLPGVTVPLDAGARGPAVDFLWSCPSPQVTEQRPRGQVQPRPASPFRWCSGDPRISCLVAPDHLQRTIGTFPLGQSPEGELCCSHHNCRAAAYRMQPGEGRDKAQVSASSGPSCSRALRGHRFVCLF